MAQTPLTQATSFCTNTQFLDFVRWGIVAEYMADEGQPITRGEVIASTKLTTLGLAATGEVLAAASVGKRYTPEDLAALTGAGAAFLQEITAGLMIRRMIGRVIDVQAGDYEAPKKSEEMLELLNKGERIFPLLQAAEAGLSDSVIETAQNMIDRNSVTYLARRLFGCRTVWRE